MFMIEALKAKHGDCLLLHWGTAEEPRLALIDGGPNTVFANALKPRLEELADGNQLRIDLMMLSHIDDDHINGLLDLGDAIEEGSLSASIDLVWFNSLEGLLDSELPPTTDGATAAFRRTFGSPDAERGPWEEKVLASVPQGQSLDALVARLGLDATLNWPYPKLVMRGLKPRTADVQGLKLTPVAPDREAVEALRTIWKQKRVEQVTAARTDHSPYNLSSIVVVAEFEGKTMLLTGDALGSEIIEGLDAIGYAKTEGRYHFDLIKLPHHGSPNNVTPEFFQQVTAEHYLVSGDHVQFPNPNEKAMKWLADARKGDSYTIACTYPLDLMTALFGDKLITPTSGTLDVRVKLS